MPFDRSVFTLLVLLFGALYLLLWRRRRSDRTSPRVDPFFAFLIAAERATSSWRRKEVSVAWKRRETELATRLVIPFYPRDIDTVDLVAKARGRRIPVRRYLPPGSGRRPVIVYFHGGGWVTGSIETHDGLCRGLAASSGCAVLSVEYSLAPEARFPTPIQEGTAVLEWLADRGASPELDASRIILGGDSAGAAIAAALCIHLRDLRYARLPPIAAQVLFVPATDLSRFDTESYRNFGEGYMLTERDIRWFRDQYLRDLSDAYDPLASPLRAASLAGLPPAFIASAGLDPLSSDGEQYAKRLREAGVPVEFIKVPGVVHAFIGVPTRPGRETLARAGAWIAATLGLPTVRRKSGHDRTQGQRPRPSIKSRLAKRARTTGAAVDDDAAPWKRRNR